MCIIGSSVKSSSPLKNTGLRQAYQNLGSKLVFSMNSDARHIKGVGSCVILMRPDGVGKRAIVLPKMQYDKRKTRLPNMSWPTPEMYRRHGLGLLSLPEACLVKGLPPVTQDCLSGPAYVKEGGLRKVEPYFDTLKTHISRHYKPCGVGVKLLTYLENRFTSTPKRLFQVMLKTKQLAVNCEVVEGDHVLKEGDVIMHTMHKHEHAILDLDVEVVHDTEDMLVVSKPSSWPVHPVSNYRMNTLSFVLQKEMGYKDLRAMHRIDAATSGICMMAKGWEAAARLSDKFRAGPTRKEYLALVDGRFPQDQVVCKKPLDRYRLTRKVWKEMKSSREAETIFSLLRYCPRTDTSLVSCKPVTGRTHQIRLHLTMLGFPIVHDPLYNDRDAKPRLTLGDWEEHPEVVGALDRMEQQLTEDMLVRTQGQAQDRTEQQLNEGMLMTPAEVSVHQSEPATGKEIYNLQSNLGKWQIKGTEKCLSGKEDEPEEDVRSFSEEGEGGASVSEQGENKVSFAGLSQFANFKYCLQCQASHLLGTMTPQVMCLHSHRYSIGQPEENLAFEASPPFWAENPSTVRPTLANKP